jgi:hypothetical protein
LPVDLKNPGEKLRLVTLVGDDNESLARRRRHDTRQMEDLGRGAHALERAGSTTKKFFKRSDFAENISSSATPVSTTIFILFLDMDMLAAIDILVAASQLQMNRGIPPWVFRRVGLACSQDFIFFSSPTMSIPA